MKEKIQRAINSQGFRNSSWNLINTISYPVAVLAITPFFITQLGADQYGIWVLINTTTQLMSIFNFGLGDTAVKYVSSYKAIEKHESIQRTVSLIWGIGLLVFGFSLMLGVIFYFLLKDTSLFDITLELIELAAVTALLGFILFGLKFLEQIILSVSQGYGRYDTASKLSLASRISILICNFILVYFDYSLREVFISSVVVLLIFLVVEITVIRSMFSIIMFTPSFNKASFQNIYRFGFWSWGQSLLAIVTTQTDKLIVAYFSGVYSLTYYSLGSLIATHLHGIFTSASAWVFPSVSMKASKEESLISFYRKAELILLGLGFVSIICFFLLQKYILLLWLGEDTYTKSIPYIKIFVYYNLFLLLNIMPYYFLNGSGYVKQNTAAEFITKVLNIFGMVACYVWFGVTGLIWGLVFSMLIATPVRMMFLNKHILKLESTWFLKPLVCPALIVFAFESENIILRTFLLITFTISFYAIYIRHLYNQG